MITYNDDPFTALSSACVPITFYIKCNLKYSFIPLNPFECIWIGGTPKLEKGVVKKKRKLILTVNVTMDHGDLAYQSPPDSSGPLCIRISRGMTSWRVRPGPLWASPRWVSRTRLALITVQVFLLNSPREDHVGGRVTGRLP